jgi:hypothetical protein
MSITRTAVAVSMAAAAMFMLPSVAPAADLGGECCADLEERISELEASTARKGNRKMSVTISGEVNQAYLYTDIFGNTDDGLVDNGTELVVRGDAALRPGSAVGFYVSVDLDASTGDVDADKAYVWISGEVGTLSIGTRGHASDGSGETTVANTDAAAELLSAFGASVDDGGTTQVIRYDSPAIGPMTVSASWGADDEWSAALRFATESGGFRLAMSAGYHATDAGYEAILASGGIKHMQSGLFVHGAAALIDGEDTVYHVQAGLERDFFAIGQTTIFAEYGVLDFGGPQIDGFGVGFNQALDAASTDLYLSYRTTDDLDMTAIMGGVRVRF